MSRSLLFLLLAILHVLALVVQLAVPSSPMFLTIVQIDAAAGGVWLTLRTPRDRR